MLSLCVVLQLNFMFFLMLRLPPRSTRTDTLFPYTTLFRSCLRYLAAGGVASEALQRLLHVDLDFTLRHAGLRCIGSWEEVGENAHHSYVAVVQLGALVHGRDWIDDGGERSAAEARLRAGLERPMAHPRGGPPRAPATPG